MLLPVKLIAENLVKHYILRRFEKICFYKWICLLHLGYKTLRLQPF